GVSFISAAVAAMSLRGSEPLKTCSFSFSCPLAPVSASIRAVSRPAASNATARASPLMGSSLGRGGEIVERDHRVGLGPDAEPAGVGEGRVARVDDLPPVEEDLEMVTDVLHLELVPDAARDLALPVAELAAAAFDDVV